MNPADKIVLPRSDEFGNFECVLGKAQVLDDSGIRRNVFTRMCEAAPITNLAFSGGGARGIAYAGVVLALDEVSVTNRAGELVSIRSQIESVSGSSAGAITAAFFATGMPANEFVESAKQVDVSILLDSKQKNRLLLFGQDGEPFYKYIRDTILRNICSFYSKLKVQSLLHHEKYNGLSKEHKKYIGDLQSRIQSTEVCYFKTHFRPRITFGHLEALRMLEPSRFKKLTVIAADSETGLKFVFSSQTTPDFEIAKACRASASIPLVLKPVTVKVGPTKLTLIDGGYVDNIPAYEAGRHQEMIPGYNVGEGGQNLSTLVFLFDGTTSLVNPFTQAGSEFRKSIFSSVKGGWLSRDLLPRVFGAIKGPTRLTVTRLSSLSDVQEFYSMRNIALKVDGISTVDFKQALNIASTLIENARKQTTEFFQEHGGTQRTFERYDSIDELLTKLAPSKFNQLNNILNKAGTMFSRNSCY